MKPTLTLTSLLYGIGAILFLLIIGMDIWEIVSMIFQGTVFFLYYPSLEILLPKERRR